MDTRTRIPDLIAVTVNAVEESSVEERDLKKTMEILREPYYIHYVSLTSKNRTGVLLLQFSPLPSYPI